MASIHDVARLAEVSAATVSKYLNQKGYISPGKRQAIMSAIEALHYAPNRSARQLKTMSSQDIFYIVPNIAEKLYREIMVGVNAQLGTRYRLVIQLTNDNLDRETAILRECINNPCAGILLCTCAPENNTLFDKLCEQTPLFFLLRKPQNAHHYNYLGFHQADIIYSITTELIKNGLEDIGLYTDNDAFSCEAEAKEAFELAFAHMSRPLRPNRIFSIPFSKEAIFRSIMRLFDSGDFPCAFIATSYMAAHAINEVAYFRDLELGRDLFLFALGEDSWYNSMFNNKIICTYRDAQKLGAAAATALKAQLEAPMVFEKVNLALQDGFAYQKIGEYVNRLRNIAPPRAHIHPSQKIRIAFNATDSGTDALKSLVPQFVKQEGIDVEFCEFPHHDLYETLNRMAAEKSAPFDLFSVDGPWLPYLASKDLLHDLTGVVQSGEIAAHMASSVLENIGMVDGRVLGLPYTYSMSLLFYRKDLFEDPDICARFFRQYKVKLAPPKTWHMFNIIASFFTRSIHPESPTLYGTSIFGGNFAAAMCTEIFPRIWAYNGTVFDRRGFVRLYSHENYDAYMSLIQTIRCCAPDVLGYNAFEGINQLMTGETAMGVVFSNNASLLADSARNTVSEKIGFAPIPNQKPVAAGWCISVNRYSPNLEYAHSFIRWFSSLELSSAYTILGGAAPLTPLLDLEPLMQLYPWNAVARREYHTAKRREIPTLPGVPLLDEVKTEEILASVIFQYFQRKGSLDSLLFDAHQQLCAYAQANGYPTNSPIHRLMLSEESLD